MLTVISIWDLMTYLVKSTSYRTILEDRVKKYRWLMGQVRTAASVQLINDWIKHLESELARHAH